MADKFEFTKWNVTSHRGAILVTADGKRINYRYDSDKREFVVKEVTPDGWDKTPVLKVCYTTELLASYLNGLDCTIEKTNYHAPDIMDGYRRYHRGY